MEIVAYSRMKGFGAVCVNWDNTPTGDELVIENVYVKQGDGLYNVIQTNYEILLVSKVNDIPKGLDWYGQKPVEEDYIVIPFDDGKYDIIANCLSRDSNGTYVAEPGMPLLCNVV